jgi:hypothetical protein
MAATEIKMDSEATAASHVSLMTDFVIENC